MTEYKFKCKKCGLIKNIKCDPKEIKTLKVQCDCGEQMIRDFRSSLVVPESLKAENRDEVEWANQRLKNTPSGRKTVL